MKRLIIALLVVVMATVAQAKDIYILVVTTTPQMHCQNCEQKIKGNLKFEKGVQKIETSIERQTVTIFYDADKTTAPDLIRSFEKFGYRAKPISNKPVSPKAKTKTKSKPRK